MPSAAAVQLSARPGMMLVVPVSNSTRRLYIGTETRRSRAGGEELRIEALGAAFGAVDEGLGGEGGAAPASRAAAARPAAARRGCSWWFGVRMSSGSGGASRNHRRAARQGRLSGRQARVAVLQRLGQRCPGRHGRRRSLARRRQRAHRGEPVGVAQRAPERGHDVFEPACTDFRGEPVDRRTQVPRADEGAEERIAALQQLRNDVGMGELGRRRGACPRSRRWRAAMPSSRCCAAGRRGSRRTGRATAARRSRRPGAPCGRRLSTSESRARAEKRIALGIEDRSQDDVGDGAAQALGADHRHGAGEVDLGFVVAALERAGRAADDLGGEDDVFRDPAGDIDRRVALRRAASSSAAGSRAALAAASRREACRRRSPRRAAPSGAGRPGRAGPTLPAMSGTPTIQRKNAMRCLERQWLVEHLDRFGGLRRRRHARCCRDRLRRAAGAASGAAGAGIDAAPSAKRRLPALGGPCA